MLAVLKGAPKFVFQQAHQHKTDTPNNKFPVELLAHADFHGEAGGEMHSCLAAASPFAPAENTAAVLVPQELHISTLYPPTLSKSFALMACWQQLTKIQLMCMHVHTSKISVYHSAFSLISFLLNSVDVG